MDFVIGFKFLSTIRRYSCDERERDHFDLLQVMGDFYTSTMLANMG
jgi:hypothetical protein